MLISTLVPLCRIEPSLLGGLVAPGSFGPQELAVFLSSQSSGASDGFGRRFPLNPRAGGGDGDAEMSGYDDDAALDRDGVGSSVERKVLEVRFLRRFRRLFEIYKSGEIPLGDSSRFLSRRLDSCEIPKIIPEVI